MIQPATEVQIGARVVRMAVVKPPASAAAATKGYCARGACSDAARQWHHQKLEAELDRNQFLAAIYERLVECPSPAIEWLAMGSR